MKYKYWLFLLTVGFLACEGEREILFQGPEHVVFSEATSRVVENNNYPSGANQNEPIDIEIHIVGQPKNTTTAIRYDIFGTAELGVDYRLLESTPGEVLIPAGELFATLQLIPINNFEREPDKNVVLVLSEASNGLEVGRNDFNSFGVTHTITISDDDCLKDLRLLEGTWEFDQDDGEFVYDVEVSIDFDLNNTIIFEGFAGLGLKDGFLRTWPGYDADSTNVAFATLDLCTSQMTIPDQTMIIGGFLFGDTRSEETGLFDAVSGTMQFTYFFQDIGVPYSIRATKKSP